MDRDGRVLILKRGNQVGSYRGRWAGVAGFMEGTPVEQAYTELREEVGLGSDDVHLLAEGELLNVTDSNLDRKWIVHPFLFLVDDPNKVRLDWEHTECRWIEPGEIRSFETVPGLPEALARVYVE